MLLMSTLLGDLTPPFAPWNHIRDQQSSKAKYALNQMYEQKLSPFQ